MNRAWFDEYIATFNSGDFAACMGRYFTPDVVLQGAKIRAQGDDMIRFLSDMRKAVREEIDIIVAAFDQNHILAEAKISFIADRDSPDFFLQPLCAGEMLQVRYMLSYTLVGDRIRTIRTYRWPPGQALDA